MRALRVRACILMRRWPRKNHGLEIRVSGCRGTEHVEACLGLKLLKRDTPSEAK